MRGRCRRGGSRGQDDVLPAAAVWLLVGWALCAQAAAEVIEAFDDGASQGGGGLGVCLEPGGGLVYSFVFFDGGSGLVGVPGGEGAADDALGDFLGVGVPDSGEVVVVALGVFGEEVGVSGAGESAGEGGDFVV